MDIRLFVSSTFADLAVERDALHTRVFPRVKRFCARVGLQFSVVDLRWGVSHHAVQEGTTLKICLGEVARCTLKALPPHFMLLLGDRYGWRPLPLSVPIGQARRLTPFLDADSSRLFAEFYQLDENAVPREYTTRAKAYASGERALREIDADRLRAALADAARLAAFNPAQLRRYEASITEQEVISGISSKFGAAANVHCFFRRIEGVPDDAAAGRIYRDGNVAESERLKAALRARLPAGNVHEYLCRWDGDGPMMDHIAALCADATSALIGTVKKELRRRARRDESEQEQSLHERFGASRRQSFVGQHASLRAVSKYITSSSSRPLLITGPSGVGKTAFMAQAAELCSQRHPEAMVVVRFVGATRRASSLDLLLRELTAVLHAQGQRAELGQASASAQPVFQSQTLADIIQQYCDAVRAPANRQVVIFIDALDQLPFPADGLNLRWLGPSLSRFVKVVVSCADEALAARLVNQVGTRNVVRLDPLPENNVAAVLDIWLTSARRRLHADQREAVLAAVARTGLPLHLRLAFEEARQWPSSLVQSIRIDSTVEGVIAQLFERLSLDQNHGALMVERVLGYIAASRGGLSEQELIDVLSCDRELMDQMSSRFPDSPPIGRIADAVWARLHSDLEPYLMEREADGYVLLDFYHRSLAEAVEASYLDHPFGRRRHAALAAYFGRLTTTRLPTARALSELPYQLTTAGLWDELLATLMDLSFIGAKVASFGIAAVVDDLQFAQRSAPPDHALRAAVRDMERVLVHEAHLYPGFEREEGAIRIAQQALFAAMQLDAPGIADCCRLFLSRQSVQYLQPDWRLGTSWQRARLRDFELPDSLTSNIRPTLDGSGVETTVSIVDMAVTLDGSGAVTIFACHASDEDGHFEYFSLGPAMWDLRTGGIVHRMHEIADLQLSRIAISGDGRYAAFRGRQIIIWDLWNGRPIGHKVVNSKTDEGIHIVRCSDGLEFAALVPQDSSRSAVVWQVTVSAHLDQIVQASPSFFGLAVSGDERFAISASDGIDGHVLLWDLTRSCSARSLASGARGPVWMDAAGVQAAATCPDGLCIWNVMTGALERIIQAPVGAKWSEASITSCGGYAVFVNGSKAKVLPLDSGACHEVDGLRDVVRTGPTGPPGSVLTSRSTGFTLWNVALPNTASERASHASDTQKIFMLPGEAEVLIAGQQYWATYDVASGELRKRIQIEDDFTALGLSPDGRSLSIRRHGAIELRNIHSGDVCAKYDADASLLAFLPGERLLVVESGYYADSLRILDLRSGQESMAPVKLPTEYSGATHLMVTPNGRMALVVAGLDVNRFDLVRQTFFEQYAGPSIRLMRTKPGEWFDAAALAPDGGWVFTARGRAAVIWDLESCNSVRSLYHGERVKCLAVSADGGFVAVGGGESVTVWRLSDSRLLARVQVRLSVQCIALTVGGSRVVVANSEGSMQSLRLVSNGTGLAARDRRPRTFQVYRRTAPGEDVYVVGESEELGEWNPERAIRLTWTPSHVWQGIVAVPPQGLGRYKYLVRRHSEPPVWEAGDDRTDPADAPAVLDIWF